MLHNTTYTEVALTKTNDMTNLGKIELTFDYLSQDYKRTQFFVSCAETLIYKKALSLFRDSEVYPQECGIVVYVKNELDFARVPKLIETVVEIERIFNERMDYVNQNRSNKRVV